jgi:hypothetical protein
MSQLYYNVPGVLSSNLVHSDLTCFGVKLTIQLHLCRCYEYLQLQLHPPTTSRREA